MAENDASDRDPVPIGVVLERRALEQRERLRERGAFETSETPVDWTTGENQARLEWLMRVAGVPEQYRQATVKRCRVQEEIEAFARHAGERIDAGRGAIVFGPTGTGKSSTAALMVAEAVKVKRSVRWSYVPDLCDLMLDQWRRQQVRATQVAPDLLVWDDFGVRPFADFELGLLDQIVEARYRSRKAMVITTNLTPERMQDPAFARMRDRWRERCDAWVIGGDSQRGPVR